MKTFFAVIGVMCLIMFLLAVTASWIIRRKIRRFIAELEELGHPAAGVPPFRIALEPDNGRAWANEDEMREAGDALIECGFVRIGTFRTIPQTIGFEAWHHPGEHIYATIYQVDFAPTDATTEPADAVIVDASQQSPTTRPVQTTWIDLTSRSDNGRTFTCSSGLDNMLGHPDDFIPHYLPGCPPAQLLDEFRSRRPSGSTIGTSVSAFPEAFVESWHRVMDWHIRTGGPTREAIAHVLSRDGQSVDERTIDQVRREWSVEIAEFLHLQLTDAWITDVRHQKSGTGFKDAEAAIDWETMRTRLVVIHEHSTSDEVATRIDNAAEFDETDAYEPAGRYDVIYEEAIVSVDENGPRQAFRALNEQLPPNVRYRRIGQLAEPIAADIYLEPDAIPYD